MTTHPAVANMSLAVPLEEQFKCCICLDIFTHPTSIPCGHNFCLECIEGFWDTKRKPECPLCKEKFKKRPSLKINCGFAEIIEIYKRQPKVEPQILQTKRAQEESANLATPPGSSQVVSNLPAVLLRTSPHATREGCGAAEAPADGYGHFHHNSPLRKTQEAADQVLHERPEACLCEMDKKTSIKQMIHARRRKMEQINNSVDLIIHKTKRFHCVNEQKITEREIQGSAKVCSLLITAIEKNQARLVEELEQKHQEAERRAAELLQELQQEIRELQARGIELVQLEQIDVTLDPETASGWLVLSPDRKKVAVGSQKNNLVLDSPRRFNSCVCVSGKQSFATGRRYWVVQVGNKTDWDLGVARESINRKGAIAVRPDSGYWAICRRKGAGLNACAGPSVKLCLKETPQKVGVFLDYDEGLVSFYDAEAKTHIYTYSGCDFNEPLNPYFNPCVPDEGKNIAPLIICPVEESVN
uniref:Uncharacterized protein n=1 Tax=Gasterosteus aculeatus TaxID=69293 RepID=G3Q4W9_GASAC